MRRENYVLDLSRVFLADRGYYTDLSDYEILKTVCDICRIEKKVKALSRAILTDWLQGLELSGIEFVMSEQAKLLEQWYGKTVDYWLEELEEKPNYFFKEIADCLEFFGNTTAVIAGKSGCIKTFLENGISSYSGMTESDFRKNGFQVVDMFALRKIQDKYLESLQNHWEEVSVEEYEKAMEELPPLKWKDDGFFCREPTEAYIYAFYQKLDGKYYTSLQEIFKNREEILENLETAIESGNVKAINED